MNRNLLLTGSVLFAAVVLAAAGCSGRSTSGNRDLAASDTVSVPDTGYTGIKQYFSGNNLIKEVTFENGVRQGLMRTFYAGGQLYQTFWYENGLREDSARWFYTEGQVFRATPYVHDTVHGTQVQYYRTGRVKARLRYIKGLREPFLEEFTTAGKRVTGYPEISYTINDNYNSSGKVRVNLELTDKSTKVKFYRGEFTNGVFDTARVNLIKTTSGKAFIDLKKTGTPQRDNLGIIAEISTAYGNRYLTSKNIKLPYGDLK